MSNCLSIGNQFFGFKVKEKKYIKSIESDGYELEHLKSGARVIYLDNNDSEKFFSIGLKTPPPDNTGLPHILEHSVLCGSKNYPVKDPFIELLRSSTATFLNAMTYPDKTVYPCASMNEQDFYNIVKIYCDAVYFPLIKEEHFRQEGCRYELSEEKNPNSSLNMQGVVFNEMKGAYSGLEEIMMREETKTLFPDNEYGNDSGGDPESIPELTYEDFKNFHSKYYHPSNSYIFVYGNLPIKKLLYLLNQNYLIHFDRIDFNPEIKKQKNFKKPIKKEATFPLGKSESKENQAAGTINFKTNNITNTTETLSLSILDDYLLGNSASPLRKALIDSKEGKALASSGYADFQRDTYFTVGLNGMNENRTEKVSEITFNILRDEVKNGLDRQKLEYAFNKLELISKEIHSSLPLILMDRIYSHWIYQQSPLDILDINSHIKKLRDKIKEEPQYFENLINKYFLNNPHYSLISFLPDKDYFIKKEESFNKLIQNKKTEMTEDELKEIQDKNDRLEKMHQEPDTKEKLETIPKLKLTDISDKPTKLNVGKEIIKDQPFLIPDIYSNDICYIKIGIDLNSIPDDLIDYLPIYRLALLKMGAAGHSYSEMAEREASSTGGIKASLSCAGEFENPNNYNPFMTLTSKCLASKQEEMLNILSDKLKSCDFSNTDRLKTIIRQSNTLKKNDILSSGSSYAIMNAAKNINYNYHINNRFNGISHLRFLNKTANNFDEERNTIVKKLRELHKLLNNKNRFSVSFIGSNNENQKAKNWYLDFLSSLDNINYNKENNNSNHFSPTKDGIYFPSDVNFNSMALPLTKYNISESSTLFFLAQHLTFNYLWDEIRTKGGAYGANTHFTPSGSAFGFTTFRDPNISNSITTFYETEDFLSKALEFDNKEIRESIIGSIKKLDKPIRPMDALNISLHRHITNTTYENREKFRHELLNTNKEKIQKVYNKFLKNKIKNSSISSIASKEAIEEYNTLSKDKLNIEALY